MAKRRQRLREFEKNNRVLDISSAQEKRKEEKEKKKNRENEEVAPEKGKKRRSVKGVCLLVCLVFLLMAGATLKNIYELKGEESALQAKNEELTRMKEELTLQLENVNSDEYIEEQARKELKLMKGNELIFYFTEDDKSDE